MAHTYAHLPPNTAHACARLTLVCAHASNHGSGARPPHPSGPLIAMQTHPLKLLEHGGVLVKEALDAAPALDHLRIEWLYV